METLYPHHNQVFDYIQSYAKHFDLIKHIRFNTKVVSIKYEASSHEEIQVWDVWGGNKGKWTVTTQDLLNQSTEVSILCLRFFPLKKIVCWKNFQFHVMSNITR